MGRAGGFGVDRAGLACCCRCPMGACWSAKPAGAIAARPQAAPASAQPYSAGQPHRQGGRAPMVELWCTALIQPPHLLIDQIGASCRRRRCCTGTAQLLLLLPANLCLGCFASRLSCCSTACRPPLRCWGTCGRWPRLPRPSPALRPPLQRAFSYSASAGAGRLPTLLLSRHCRSACRRRLPPTALAYLPRLLPPADAPPAAAAAAGLRTQTSCAAPLMPPTA